ncbi:MAG TPA: ATP-binding protein [Anaerolineae bacterium]|nr:ATP-binding protein [Anaerolineae bacterium]
MDRFFGRQREIGELNALAAQRGAQFILVYGRRRVGKTTLLLQWAVQTGRPLIYWVAARDTPAQVRYSFARALWAWAYPGSQAAPRFDSWEAIFEAAAHLIGDQPVILLLDEFSYAAESDPALPSYLQAAWDHLFKSRALTLVLAGSHIGMMVEQMGYNAPLYGRFTGQLPVGPLAFAALRDFLPRYTAAERVAVYAVAGGIPAYLERFDDGQSVGANLKRLFMQRTGMFHSEPFLLIGDVIRRETQTYEAILKAIAAGSRTPQEIGAALGLTSSYLSPYLKRLESLRLVERRLPATVPRERRATSRNSRYHLADPYLRFYFRFIAPNLDLVEQELTNLLWERIGEEFRAFVGMTAFEELCRQWVLAQARAGRLPFLPEIVGSHWAADVQVDVVALNWRERAVLLGECKWGTHPVGRDVVRELIEVKTPQVLAELPEGGAGWRAYHAFFARAGFTEAARAQAADARLVDLATLDADLAKEEA